MTDRELMQQALKALDWISRANAMDYEYRIKANEVLPALRERLAQNLEMDEAIAAGDGTLHGAIDYWQERALKAEARLAQKDEQAEPTRDDVIAFLLGEGPLDGVWFDEPHPTYKGRFWWREYLLKATEPSAEPVAYRLHETHIYDFAGWLTTRPGVMPVGSTSDAAPMADAVGEYIRKFPERFTKPPTRSPLTDEALWEMWVKSPRDVLRFARAIERANGIGEKK